MKSESKRVVRAAVGAGRWFPGDRASLKRMVDGFISGAGTCSVTGAIVAAVAPHAGYVYSGPAAGYVFSALRAQTETRGAPETVVILGFSHNRGFPGVALMDGDAISTPLGETPLDRQAAEIIAKGRDAVEFNYAPHMGEHSAENQVPFVQSALPQAKLVLAIMGDHSERTIGQLADGLAELARARNIVVIASSDMLHDPDYDLVTRTDKASLKLVEAMDSRKLLKEWSYDRQIFCGIAPLAAAMRFAVGRGCKRADVLHYENSGDRHPEGRGQWVVGYGAIVFAVPAE